LVSRKVAGISDIWTITDNDNNSVRPQTSVSIKFTAEELARDFLQTRKWEEDGDHTFRDHPLTTVYYEDLSNEPEKVFRKITDFLKVSFRKPKTHFHKQGNKELTATIENYAELKSVFTNTEWHEFFDE
jgi:hypothetical protein